MRVSGNFPMAEGPETREEQYVGCLGGGLNGGHRLLYEVSS